MSWLVRSLCVIAKLLGEKIAIPEGLYPGDYLKGVGAILAQQHGSGLLDGTESEKWLPIVKDAAIDAMLDLIRDDLHALNIKHDYFFSRTVPLHKSTTGSS